MYQLSEIAEQQLITVTHSFAAVNGSTFSQVMNVFFQPDFMIVRGLTYSTSGGTAGTFAINCDIVNNDIGFFSVELQEWVAGQFNAVSHYVSPPMAFKMPPGKMISGNVNFAIRDAAGAAPALPGEIALQLEFAKLKNLSDKK